MPEFWRKLVAQIPLWSPERPALHDVVLASETDQIADRIGFRTIKTRGTDMLLNDRPVFLRGICIHEENPLRGGRAYSVEGARMLLGRWRTIAPGRRQQAPGT